MSNHSELTGRGHIAGAMIDTLPLAIAVIPWGILTGALALQAGFTPLQAQVLSLLIFAGAAQLSAISLTSGGASMLAILGSTFVISSRHLLYSITFRQYVIHLPLHLRVSLAFLLTDEMFAISQTHTQRTGVFNVSYALASGLTFYAVWNIATFVGIVAGESLENLDALGLDFAIAATFIAMTVDQIRHKPVFVAIVVSGVTSVLVKPFLNDGYIVVAGILGMLAAYWADSYGRKNNNNHDELIDLSGKG